MQGNPFQTKMNKNLSAKCLTLGPIYNFKTERTWKEAVIPTQVLTGDLYTKSHNEQMRRNFRHSRLLQFNPPPAHL